MFLMLHFAMFCSRGKLFFPANTCSGRREVHDSIAFMARTEAGSCFPHGTLCQVRSRERFCFSEVHGRGGRKFTTSSRFIRPVFQVEEGST